MRAVPSILLAFAVAAVIAGCSAPATRLDLPTINRGWPDTGTPAPTIALAREMRYYVDEQGIFWDDRGRKHDTAL